MKETSRNAEKSDGNEVQRLADISTDGNVVRETSRMPFLMLGLDLPPPPLFKDAMEKNIIPQVCDTCSPSLFSFLTLKCCFSVI